MQTIVLVSGWAMPACSLCALTCELQTRGHNVATMALSDADSANWHDLMAALEHRVGDQQVVLVGWSLGGNLCMRYAGLRPNRISAVVTLASTPCFVVEPGWPAGMDTHTWQRFMGKAEENIEQAMAEFVYLTARHAENEKKTFRLLHREAMATATHRLKWSAMLALLAEDARSHWQAVSAPVHHLLAEGDLLTRPATAALLQSHFPAQKVSIVPGSHALFVDHAKSITDLINTLALEAQ